MSEALSKTRLYRIWNGMKQRCYYKNDPVYKVYGGRGITVCDEWKNSFQAFAEWSFANGYDDPPMDAEKGWINKCALSIDRIDNDKGYSPENCRWIPRSENVRRSGKELSAIVDSIAAHLKKARKVADLSQMQVEALTGISHKSISNWENGVSRPSIENAIVLARLYDVTVDELIGA